MSDLSISQNSSEDSVPVTLTSQAIQGVKSFQNGNTDGVLRLGVRGGGCSGFQYAIALDYAKEDDIVYQQEDISVAIDPLSLPYLKGSILDFKNEINNSGFQFENPNVVSSCGCNSSFRVKEGEGCDSTQGIYGFESAV